MSVLVKIKENGFLAFLLSHSFQVAGSEVKISPNMSNQAITNGHSTSTEDFTKHVFGGEFSYAFLKESNS